MPNFMISMVEGTRGQADHVGGAKIGDDAVIFEGAADAPGGLVSFQGDMTAAAIGFSGGADLKIIGRRRQDIID